MLIEDREKDRKMVRFKSHSDLVESHIHPLGYSVIMKLRFDDQDG